MWIKRHAGSEGYDPALNCLLNRDAIDDKLDQINVPALVLHGADDPSLTCKTWYNILSTNKFCYNKNTKLTLLNENQLITVSNSKVLRHINKIEIGKYECGLSISKSINFQFHFTSLNCLKLCFISLIPLFIMNLFNSISQTLQKLILAMQSYRKLNLNRELSDPTTSCLVVLSSLHLLPNLTYFFILVTSSTKIEFDINKYFKHLTKLEKLIIRQDNYTCKRKWFDIVPNDLRILSCVPYLPQ
ncbi:unnamed protein product, partial [Rotaria sp. Silwood1]